MEHLQLVAAPGKALPMVLTVEVQSREGESLAKIRGPVLDLAALVGGPVVPSQRRPHLGEPTTEVVDRRDIAWPFDAGDDAKLLLIHVLPDFSLPANVWNPEVGREVSASATTLVIYL